MNTEPDTATVSYDIAHGITLLFKVVVGYGSVVRASSRETIGACRRGTQRRQTVPSILAAEFCDLLASTACTVEVAVVVAGPRTLKLCFSDRPGCPDRLVAGSFDTRDGPRNPSRSLV